MKNARMSNERAGRLPFPAHKKSETPKNLAEVGLAELESATPCPPDKYANQLRYNPIRGDDYITNRALWEVILP